MKLRTLGSMITSAGVSACANFIPCSVRHRLSATYVWPGAKAPPSRSLAQQLALTLEVRESFRVGRAREDDFLERHPRSVCALADEHSADWAS